jgi:hypothetical protein
VVVRWLILALASGALLLAGCGSGGSSGDDDAAKEIAGDWTGTLKQKGLKRFLIAVRIEAAGTGRVAYTGT